MIEDPPFQYCITERLINEIIEAKGDDYEFIRIDKDDKDAFIMVFENKKYVEAAQ